MPRRHRIPEVHQFQARLDQVGRQATTVISMTDSGAFNDATVTVVRAWLADDGHREPLSFYRKNAAEVARSMSVRAEVLWNALDVLHLEFGYY